MLHAPSNRVTPFGLARAMKKYGPNSSDRVLQNRVAWTAAAIDERYSDLNDDSRRARFFCGDPHARST